MPFAKLGELLGRRLGQPLGVLLASPGGAAPPDAPTGLTLDGKTSGDNTDLTPTAAWDAVTGATSYVVELSESSEVNGTTGAFVSAIEIGTPTDPTFTFADILAYLPTTLYCHVAAVGAGGQGAFSSIVTLNAPMIYDTADLIFVYDPAKQNFSDAAYSTPVTDGQTVGSFRDQSVSDLDMKQATSTARPTWHAADADYVNQPTIEYDGGDWLGLLAAVALFANRAEWECLMVLEHPNTSTNTDGFWLIADGSKDSNTPLYGICISSGNVAGRIRIENSSGNVQTAGATSIIDGAPHIMKTGRITAGTGYIRLDMVQEASGALPNPAITVNQVALGGLWRIAIGRLVQAGYKLRKAMVWSSYDTTHEREARLAQEVGLDFSAAAAAPDPDPADVTFGFGEDAVGGGDGASVLTVTNLNGSGAGSFKEAVETVGARKVVFTGLHGWIDQAWTPQTSTIYQHFLTIAGETAAGLGVGIKRGSWSIACHHLIARYLKLVPGEGATEPNLIDGLGVILAAHDLFLSHMTMAGSTDELLQIWGSPGDPYKMTLADSIIAGALDNAGHPEGNHAMGVLMDRGWYKFSFIRNLIGAGELRDRIPKMTGASGTYEVDWLNNVIVATDVLPYFVAPMKANIQGNVIINLTSDQNHDYRLYGGTSAAAAVSQVYVGDNIAILADGSTRTPVPLTDAYTASIPTSGSRIAMPYDSIMASEDVLTYVLANAGAQRSALEEYLIDRVTNRTTTRINSIADMGGYPTL